MGEMVASASEAVGDDRKPRRVVHMEGIERARVQDTIEVSHVARSCGRRSNSMPIGLEWTVLRRIRKEETKRDSSVLDLVQYGRLPEIGGGKKVVLC